VLMLVLVRRGGCDVEGRRKGGRGWGVDVMLKVGGEGRGEKRVMIIFPFFVGGDNWEAEKD